MAGFVKDHLETVEQGCCGCFCLESVNDEIKVSRPDDQGVLQVVGCRSLNCRAVKAKDLIHVARSNHFAQVERRDDILDESCRRDWELADEGFTEVRVGPSQEKDSDFFYKVRSFLKRQGRILHKQGKVRMSHMNLTSLFMQLPFSQFCICDDLYNATNVGCIPSC